MLKRISLFLFLVIPALAVNAQVHHAEPLNWWVGMKNPNLQILINGDNVAELTPVIDYPGVKLTGFTRGDSKNYLFLDLSIQGNTKPGNMMIRFIKNDKTVFSYPYTLAERKQAPDQFKGFTAEDVIYLLVPDRFANGDTSNDVVPGMREKKTNRKFDGGRHGGDIRGIINHLDYIRDMGFTAIWSTPLLENDMESYSYHGYSITDHYKVDPRFGNLDDYKELAAKAKQKGIKLIYDEVLNHIGSNYWWMNDLPFTNWLNYPETKTNTNHRRTVNQDRYAANYDKNLMTKGWFVPTMPDMNGQNPFVANYLIQNSIWWIETLQLGGLRQDTYGYSDKTFLKNWSCRIMDEYPQFTMVGEEWSTNPLITAYWQRGKQNPDGYAGCLTSIMDFPLQAALVESLTITEGKDFNKGFAGLYEALANDFVYADPKNILVFGDNHDMDRLFMQLHQDTALMKMAITYLLTIRGIPQWFYGTEILMDNTGHHKVDGLIRADFPGGWPGDQVNAFTGEGLTASAKNMQAYVKQLLNWRKANPVIGKGETLHFAPFNGVYVYFRYDKKKLVMVAMNKNESATTIATERFQEILKGKLTATNIIDGVPLPLQKLTLAPKSATIFDIR